MNVVVYTLNAFAKGERGGNPAGVVLEGEDLSLDASEMRLIAKELGFSETAFMEKSKLANYKISYFTPLAKLICAGTPRFLHLDSCIRWVWLK